jgi:hypothetical protein
MLPMVLPIGLNPGFVPALFIPAFAIMGLPGNIAEVAAFAAASAVAAAATVEAGFTGTPM